MKSIYFLPLAFIFFTSLIPSSFELFQWRGPVRDGSYPDKGLLKQWPVQGPKMVWSTDTLGDGYGSPVITNEGVYVMGATADSTGYLYSFDLGGKLRWRSSYGPEWSTNFPGSRSTPTIAGDLVYVASGKGNVVCFNRQNGTKRWEINLFSTLHGVNTQFGYTESLLIDGNKLFCMPGGKDTNLVAINRFSGQLIWTSKGNGEPSGFCSPNIIRHEDQSILVTFSQQAMIGVNPQTGELLFTHKQDTICNVHSNTPIYDKGNLIYVSGDGNRTVKLKLGSDGRSVSELWRCKEFDNVMGGVVRVGDLLIGTGHRKQELMALDLESGSIVSRLKVGRGATIYADGMIYLYNEKGQVYLIDPSQNQLKEVSSFKIDKGTKEHFAHPVIGQGMLLIRHGKSLMAYQIKA